ncbi:MAG: M24 family metallopeptidase [Pirellulaceae bacterium]
MSCTATLIAGVPLENPAFYHRVRFGVGDPAAWIQINEGGALKTQFIVRDIEMGRARESVEADQIACPADFTPEGGLSGDRATATAQAVAECLRRAKVESVTTDRTLPFIYAWHIQAAGIQLDYCAELGVRERRSKDEQELAWLQEAQKATEAAMELACTTIAKASASADGVLQHEGQPLTSERVRKMISVYLLDKDYLEPHGSIVATKPHNADCHERGTGELVTGEAVIVDIFPQCKKTHYCGDCTRTVVHGDPSDTMRDMSKAVIAAKAAATDQLRVGKSADDVHGATKAALEQHGFPFRRGEVSDTPVMPHGTGHGIGLEVHEPILLDDNGGDLVENEVLTIEPGLYSRNFGGVRVEDMVVCSKTGPKSLNSLQEGLKWD